MTKYIALLRGINVGGKRKILMKDLKLLFKNLGFKNISTYIQTGNVFFSSEKTKKEISPKIKTEIFKQFAFNVPVIIRTTKEMNTAFLSNPFVKRHALEKLHLTFLNQSPTQEKIKALKELTSKSPDQFEIIGKNAFILCQDKYHKSKLSNSFFEKKLNVTTTTRNWKTLAKLVELSQ